MDECCWSIKGTKINLQHFQTPTNRFFDPTLVSSVKVWSIASFSVSHFFWSKGTDDQEWRNILINRIVKLFPIDFGPKISL